MRELNGLFKKAVDDDIISTLVKNQLQSQATASEMFDTLNVFLTNLQKSKIRSQDLIPHQLRIRRILDLIHANRYTEALFFSNFTSQTKSDKIYKAGFDPSEPRDWHGRWSKDGLTPTSNTDVIDIAYQGNFHDSFVNDIVAALRQKGSKVVKEVSLTAINGITARADMLVRPVGGDPYVVEVKTGQNPKFTDEQNGVYPLICTGPHATSFDQKISELDIKPGSLLPQMDVYVVYTRDSNSQVYWVNGCMIKALWRKA